MLNDINNSGSKGLHEPWGPDQVLSVCRQVIMGCDGGVKHSSVTGASLVVLWLPLGNADNKPPTITLAWSRVSPSVNPSLDSTLVQSQSECQP